MASYLWSWIFIIQLILAGPGYAHVSSYDYEIIARRALRNAFICKLSAEEQSRNTVTALVIAGGVMLLVILVGLFIVIQRQRQQTVPDVESALATAKPAWWMVDGKDDKLNEWRLSNRMESVIPPVEPRRERRQSSGQFRIERLKAALQIQKKGKLDPILPIHRKATTSPVLPLQTSYDIEPRYPDILERGHLIPIYPAKRSPPQITTTLDGSSNNFLQPTPGIPRRAAVTQRTTLSHSGDRSGAPRSPGGRHRRDWLDRSLVRHPFLPLQESNVSLAPKISAPVLIPVDTSNTKFAHALSLSKPRVAPSPPSGSRSLFEPSVAPKAIKKKPPPAPLEPRGEFHLSGRKVRFQLPTSPRLPRKF